MTDRLLPEIKAVRAIDRALEQLDPKVRRATVDWLFAREHDTTLVAILDQQGYAPDAATIARWWVQLNCWVWPDDLPGKPNPPGGATGEQFRYAVRGAHAVLSLFADEALVDAIWLDEPRRAQLTRPESTPTEPARD